MVQHSSNDHHPIFDPDMRTRSLSICTRGVTCMRSNLWPFLVSSARMPTPTPHQQICTPPGVTRKPQPGPSPLCASQSQRGDTTGMPCHCARALRGELCQNAHPHTSSADLHTTRGYRDAIVRPVPALPTAITTGDATGMPCCCAGALPGELCKNAHLQTSSLISRSAHHPPEVTGNPHSGPSPPCASQSQRGDATGMPCRCA